MYANRNANRNTAAFGTWMVENAPAPVEAPAAPAAKGGKAGRVFVSLIVAAAVIVALAIPALQILANV